MPEARRLTLVDQALQEDNLDAGPKVREALNRYAPSIAKVARKQERVSILQSLGVQTLEQASQVAVLRAERDARPTASEEAKHGRFRFWQGMAVGGVTGAALMLAAGATLLGQSFEQARNYGAGMVAVGAATQAASPPTTCIPGETLSDGRRCPQTTDTETSP